MDVAEWTAKERAAYYRRKAEEARALAAAAPMHEAKEGYEALAEKWTQLADSIEPMIRA